MYFIGVYVIKSKRPMNTNFTKEINILEIKSLKLIKLLEKLPDSYFDQDWFTPSSDIIEKILNYSKTVRS